MANETSTECAAILRSPALMRQWMAKIGIDIDTITGTVPAGTVDGQLLIWDNGLVVYVPKLVSGDATLTKAGLFTLATVNANVGTFGDAGDVAQLTLNGKGLTTAATNVPITTTLLSTDTFDRANNSTSMGATNGAGTQDPATWTNQSGDCGINTNQAYSSSIGGSRSIATVDLATADVDITVTHSVFDVNGQSIIFRFTDTSNYCLLLGDSGQLRLNKIVAGVSSAINAHNYGALGTGTVMRVRCYGSTIKVSVDGVESTTVATETFNQTATKHGLGFQGTSQRFDNWVAFAAPAATAMASGPAAGDLIGIFPVPSIRSSVALSGNPTTTTQTALDNSTKLATTAYVDAAVLVHTAETHSLTAQTADLADTNFTNSSTAGLYRVHVYLVDTTAAIGAGAVQANIKYTDVSQAQTQSTATVVLTTAGAFTQATYFIQKASGSISYGVTHTGIFSTAAYAFYTTCEKLS